MAGGRRPVESGRAPGTPIVHSLAFKLFLAIFLAVLLIFSVISYYDYAASRDLIYRHAEENARSITDAAVRRIDGMLATAEVAAQTLAVAAEQLSFDRGRAETLVRATVQAYPDLYGSTIALEPDPNDADGGRFAPYYHHSGNEVRRTDLADASYDYTHWPWYTRPRELGRALWSEPYFDEGGGNILMATYSVPLFRTTDGRRRFAGVLTADVALEWLDTLVSRLRVFNSGYGFLISREGRFISHPKKELVMRRTIFDEAEQLHDEGLARMGRRMVGGQSGMEARVSVVTRRESLVYFAPLGASGWSLAIVYDRQELLADLYSLSLMTFFLGFLGFAILLGVIVLITGAITRPLHRLALAAGDIANGNLDATLPQISSRDEVGRLAQVFAEMRDSLKRYIANLTSATAAKERIDSELRIARDIQANILPRVFPPFPERREFDLYAAMAPAREVGGDLYDFFLLNDGRLCFVIGDVSDKGVAAAFYMAVTKTMVKLLAMQGSAPEAVLRQVNRELCRDNPTCMFVTLFVGVLSPLTGRVDYANAGHNPPLLIAADGSTALLRAAPAPPCGAFEAAVYAGSTAVLPRGGGLFLYTDGVTESQDPAGRLFSERRLAELVAAAGRQPPDRLTATVLAELEAFVQGAPQHDDIAILALRYHGPAPAAPAAWESAALLLRNDGLELARLHEFVDAFTTKPELAGARAPLSLVLEEVFTNICKYAYADRAEHPIAVTLAQGDDAVEWSVEDDGAPFNPLARRDAAPAEPGDGPPIGGQGLKLVGKLAMRLRYERRDGKNRLTGAVGLARGAAPSSTKE